MKHTVTEISVKFSDENSCILMHFSRRLSPLLSCVFSLWFAFSSFGSGTKAVVPRAQQWWPLSVICLVSLNCKLTTGLRERERERGIPLVVMWRYWAPCGCVCVSDSDTEARWELPQDSLCVCVCFKGEGSNLRGTSRSWRWDQALLRPARHQPSWGIYTRHPHTRSLFALLILLFSIIHCCFYFCIEAYRIPSWDHFMHSLLIY